jgi:hypothetical protein
MTSEKLLWTHFIFLIFTRLQWFVHIFCIKTYFDTKRVGGGRRIDFSTFVSQTQFYKTSYSVLNWTPKICVQHIWKASLRVLLLLNPYSLWTHVSELDYKTSTFSPLQFTHAYIVSKILVRSKNFLLFGNFKKLLLLYAAKMPIIFRFFRRLFLELFLCRTCY